MRSEREIRNELEIVEPRMLQLLRMRDWKEYNYYEGYVDALEWVLREEEG